MPYAPNHTALKWKRTHTDHVAKYCQKVVQYTNCFLPTDHLGQAEESENHLFYAVYHALPFITS